MPVREPSNDLRNGRRYRRSARVEPAMSDSLSTLPSMRRVEVESMSEA